MGYTQTSIYLEDFETSGDIVKIEEYVFTTDSVSDLLNNFENSNINKKELITETHLSFSYGILEEKKVFDYSLFNDGNLKTYYYTQDVLNNRYVLGQAVYNKSKKVTENQPYAYYVLYGSKPLQFAIDGKKFQKIKKTNNLVVFGDESLELINDNQVKYTYPGLFTEVNYKIYNSKGQLIEFSGEYQNNKYSYYPDGLLKKVIGVESSKFNSIYYYKKDKYGNWIQRLKVHNSPNKKDSETIVLTTRKLTYKNGNTTGGTEYDLDFINNYILKYSGNIITNTNSTNSQNIKAEVKNTIPNGLIWKKNEEETNYWLYNNGVLVSGEGTTFWLKNDLYVYLTLKNEVYKLKEFKNLTPNVFHKAKLLPFKPIHGIWFKETEKGYRVYNNNGSQITNIEINQFAKNGVDVIFKEKGKEKTLLLNNFKNAPLNTVYKTEIYTAKNMKFEVDNPLNNYCSEIEHLINLTEQQREALEVKGWTGELEKKFLNNFTIIKHSSYFEISISKYDKKILDLDFDKLNLLLSNCISNNPIFSEVKLVKGDSYMNTSTSRIQIPFQETIGKTKVGCISGDCKNGKGKYQYEDGVYEGYFSSGMRIGMGTYTYNDGSGYVGQWLANDKHGKGLLKSKNGDIYNGDWIANKKHGQGVLLWSNGDKYEGEFKNNQIDGKGIFYEKKTGKKYNRLYKEGKIVSSKEMLTNKNNNNSKIKLDSDIAYCQSQENEGKCLAEKLSAEIDSLESQGIKKEEIDAFLQNKINIIANYKIEALYNLYLKINRENYTRITPIIKKLPQDQQNQLRSFAKKTVSNYTKQQNEYQRKKLNSQSKTTVKPKFEVKSKESTAKTGCISGDCKNGTGTYVWEDGRKYIGDWKQNKQNGSGKFIWKNGDSYEGEFLNNYLHGKGTLTWIDGRYYKGNWIHNKQSGKGVFIWSNKDKYEGDFLDNKLHGYGVYIWSTGSKYEGQWQNGKKHGDGKEFDSNGNLLFEGEFKNGQRVKTNK